MCISALASISRHISHVPHHHTHSSSSSASSPWVSSSSCWARRICSVCITSSSRCVEPSYQIGVLSKKSVEWFSRLHSCKNPLLKTGSLWCDARCLQECVDLHSTRLCAASPQRENFCLKGIEWLPLSCRHSPPQRSIFSKAWRASGWSARKIFVPTNPRSIATASWYSCLVFFATSRLLVFNPHHHCGLGAPYSS